MRPVLFLSMVFCSTIGQFIKYGFLFYHWSVYQVCFSVLPLVSLSSMLFCSTIGQFIKYGFLFYHWSVYISMLFCSTIGQFIILGRDVSMSPWTL